MLQGKKVIIGVTGSVAAYKTCELAASLKKHGAEIYVIMTDSAQKLITPLTFGALSGNPVYTTSAEKAPKI